MGPEDEGTQGQQPEGGSGTGDGINPAWNPILEYIPEDKRDEVLPHFQNWDKSYNTKVEEVQSKYADFEPFVQAQVDPEELNFGLSLAQALSNNPQEVYDALAEFIEGEQGGSKVDDGSQQLGQGQEESGGSSPFDDPRFQEVEETMRLLVGNMLESREQQELQQQQEELDQEFEAAKKNIGDFDETWVMRALVADENLSVEDAVKEYQEHINGVMTQNQRRPSPPVMGGGGSFPQNKKPNLNNGEERRNAVMQMMQQMSQNR